MSLLDWIFIRFAGKQIGILGPRAAGKTTMHTWLRDGTLPKDYRPTNQATDVAGARLTVGDGKLALKAGKDVSGDTMNDLAAWRGVIDSSQVIVYLFDAYLLVLDHEAQRRQVIRDCTMLGTEISTRRGQADRPKVAMVGTHCDLIAGYSRDVNSEDFTAMQARVLNCTSLKDARWGIQDGLGDDSPPAVILGSLHDTAAARDLAQRVFRQHFGL